MNAAKIYNRFKHTDLEKVLPLPKEDALQKESAAELLRPESKKRHKFSFKSLYRSIEEGAEQNVTPNKFTKMSVITGLVGPAVGLASVVIAAQFTPDFNWLSSPLSKILNGSMAPLFTAGVCTAGISGFIFSLGLMKSLPNTAKNILGTSSIALSSAALYAIGITGGFAHTIADSLFFFGPPIGFAMLGQSMMENKPKAGGIATIMLSAVSAVTMTLSLIASNRFIAPYEIISAAILGSWITASSMMLSIISKVKKMRHSKAPKAEDSAKAEK